MLCLGAASMGLAPSADGDIWWHLAAGREMVTRQALLFTDPFSVGAQGRPWVDVHWLFQLAVYTIHHGFGLAGLVYAKCAVVGLGSLVLLGALPNKPGSWLRPLFVTLLLCALFAARSLLLVRPVIITLVFLALFFRALERFQRDGQARHLWPLPLAQVVWANTQGLSALGVAVVAAYAAGAGLSAAGGNRHLWRPFRALSLTLGGCALGLCLTPFGLAGLALPARLAERLVPGAHNVYAYTIAENVPPFVLERWSGEFWHLKWFFAALALALVCGARRLRASHLLLVVEFSVLAVLSNRNVLLLYWVATPLAALYLAPTLQAWSRRYRPFGPRAAFALNASALVAVLGGSSVAAAREPALNKPSPFREPTESARRLAVLPASGDVFSADHQGGYLIWQLYPRLRPFIDTRLVLRSAQEYAEYLQLADQPQRFAAFQAKHHFGYVVLPVAYPDRYLSLIATLYESPDWKLIYTDGTEVLFARRDIATDPAWDLGDPAVSARILADAQRRLGGTPKLWTAARLHLATLLVATRQFGEAERTLAPLHLPEADALSARCRLAAGDTEAASRISERLLQNNRNDVSSLNLLAQVALRQGELSKGVHLLERALKVDPFDGEASAILANLEETR
ncbi:MAG: tetratricopeptide repeat protein [Polyangiaceae bacterium]